MIVVQDCGGMECHGDIVAKSKTVLKAFENFKKNCDWYWDIGHHAEDEKTVVTYDDNYIYINGEAECKFTSI